MVHYRYRAQAEMSVYRKPEERVCWYRRNINSKRLLYTTTLLLSEGPCNTTSDVSVTVTISCNIDKDIRDGIPDFVENNMAAAFADANGNT